VKEELDVPGLALENLTWRGFLVDNLLPVTIGNVIGGAVMVGTVYWLVYLREG
jgi:formate/nitrite transporter FocA (FNT family)